MKKLPYLPLLLVLIIGLYSCKEKSNTSYCLNHRNRQDWVGQWSRVLDPQSFCQSQAYLHQDKGINNLINDSLMNDFSLQMRAYISKLSINHLILFCNLNCQKMLPSYRLFSEVEDWGNTSFFENLIESVFIHLINDNDAVFNETLIEGLTENFPNLDTFDSSIASYAFDAAFAFSELIQYIKTNENNHVIENSQSCINTVDMFIQQKENIRYVNNISELEKLISQDEYMQRETNRQLTLLKELRAIPMIDVTAITAIKNLNDSFGELVDYNILS